MGLMVFIGHKKVIGSSKSQKVRVREYSIGGEMLVGLPGHLAEHDNFKKVIHYMHY